MRAQSLWRTHARTHVTLQILNIGVFCLTLELDRSTLEDGHYFQHVNHASSAVYTLVFVLSQVYFLWSCWVLRRGEINNVITTGDLGLLDHDGDEYIEVPSTRRIALPSLMMCSQCCVEMLRPDACLPHAPPPSRLDPQSVCCQGLLVLPVAARLSSLRCPRAYMLRFKTEELVELLHKKGIFDSHEQACEKLAEFDEDGNGRLRWSLWGARVLWHARDVAISHDAFDGAMANGQSPVGIQWQERDNPAPEKILARA